MIFSRLRSALPMLAFALAFGTSVTAQDNPVVVELYTSQGCSSCPPADALLHQLAQRDDVIPLALHVDYWDYIGWKDRFAKPAFSLRQRSLKQNGQTESVYTPQFVFNGGEWRGFFKRWFGGDDLLVNQNKPNVGILSLTIGQARQAQARFDHENKKLPKNMLLHVALVASNISSEVTRGENQNKRLDHDFVVLNYQAYLASSSGTHVSWFDIHAPAIPEIADEAGKLAWVAWVTKPGGKEHYQAVGGWFK